jgi:23S rRNA (adenine2503-C2)-methyltransferase
VCRLIYNYTAFFVKNQPSFLAIFLTYAYISAMNTALPNLIGLTQTQLERFAQSIGEKPYRGRQLFRWLYGNGARTFDDMTDLGKELRQRLENQARITLPLLSDTRWSSDGSTVKCLMELHDGHRIESVWMDEEVRQTLCLSSQAGCALGCRFCATGKLGFGRDLTPGEIVGQLLVMESVTGRRPTNLVMMGMGEPLLNLDNVLPTLPIFMAGDGFAISHRRITISTCGIIPGIQRLAQEKVKCKLAISLNATDQQTRAELMPIAKKFPLDALLQSVREYAKTTRYRVTFEYVLIAGINDRDEDALRLPKLLKGIPSKINLILWNSTDQPYRPPGSNRMEQFEKTLRQHKIHVSIRKSRGADIAAACGQLAGGQDISTSTEPKIHSDKESVKK